MPPTPDDMPPDIRPGPDDGPLFTLAEVVHLTVGFLALVLMLARKLTPWVAVPVIVAANGLVVSARWKAGEPTAPLAPTSTSTTSTGPEPVVRPTDVALMIRDTVYLRPHLRYTGLEPGIDGQPTHTWRPSGGTILLPAGVKAMETRLTGAFPAGTQVLHEVQEVRG